MKRTSSSARSRLRTQVRSTVSDAILDAAEEMFATHGVRKATVQQIATRAGLAVGTMYNYFADRQALVNALFAARRATLKPQLRAAVVAGEGTDFEPRLRAFVREVFAAFEAHRKFVKIAIADEHAPRPHSKTGQDLAAAIGELMADGVARQAMPASRAELATLMLIGSIRAVMMNRIVDGAPLGADADPLVSAFLDGVR